MYNRSMLTDTAPLSNDYDNAPDAEPPERMKLTSSPEFRRIFESAGAALIDGDFAVAQVLTNEMFARDEDIPVEAVAPMEIRSAEPLSPACRRHTPRAALLAGTPQR